MRPPAGTDELPQRRNPWPGLHEQATDCRSPGVPCRDTRGLREAAALINPSETITLGTTGLEVTRLGLGIGGLLPSSHDVTVRAVIRRAVGLGIRYIDTAPTYGDGRSERRLGEVSARLSIPLAISTKVGMRLEERPLRNRVAEVFLNTVAGGPAAVLRFPLKVGRVLGRATQQGMPAALNPPVARVDFSYDGIMRSIDGSLARLRTDRLGVVFLHDPDNDVEMAMSGAYRALDQLRSDGTIAAVGVSSNHWQPLVRMADEGAFDVFLIAGRYSLLDQTALAELLPMAQARGIAIIVAGVFNGGILADPIGKAFFDYATAADEWKAKAFRVKAICDRHGVDVKAAALQFPYGHPSVASVLIGVESVEELDEDWRLAGTPVPAALWRELRDAGVLSEAAPLPGEDVSRINPAGGLEPRTGTGVQSNELLTNVTPGGRSPSVL
jgi:D-threo-aldose 1-dehydrogenase